MKLTFITDQPRPVDRVWKYTDLVVKGVAAKTGVDVTWETIPAVTTVSAKAPGIAALRTGHEDLLDRIEATHPDAIVSLGSVALNGVMGDSTKFRNAFGVMTLLRGVPFIPSVAPVFCLPPRDGQLHRDFAWSVYKAVTQKAPIPAMDIEVVVPQTTDELVTALAVLDAASVVGVDVETTGLSAFNDHLIMAGIGAVFDNMASGYAVVVNEELLWYNKDLFWDQVWRKSRRSVGQNFKFDMQFLEPYIGHPPDGAMTGDTLLLAHLLDERPGKSRARGNGLKDFVAMRYDHPYGFEFNEDGVYDDAELAEMRKYLGEDVCYTARLWFDQVAEVKEEGSGVFKVHEDHLIGVSRVISRGEMTGAPLDVPYVNETIARMERRVARRERTLMRALVRLAPTQTVENLSSSRQVAEVIWSEWDVQLKTRRRVKARTTDKEVLSGIWPTMVESGDPVLMKRGKWIKVFLEWRAETHTLTAYKKSLGGRVDSDGRVRASFLLHGAATGRISSMSPNLQNIGAVDENVTENGRKRYKLRDGSWTYTPMRKAFAPPNGRLWVEADYSQLELRVAAGLSGDERFRQVFLDKRDIHREVAAAVFGKEAADITKAERFMAKAVSFGIIYGRGGNALANGGEMDFYVSMGGVRWTEAQADNFIKAFLRGFPELNAWMGMLYKTVPKQGYVETPRGRRRRFPLQERAGSHGEKAIQRQAVNTPVQAEASDLCLAAMVSVQSHPKFDALDAEILFPVHDSICFESSAGDVDNLEDLCREVMEIDYRGVPLTIDFEYGPTWADTTTHQRSR